MVAYTNLTRPARDGASQTSNTAPRDVRNMGIIALLAMAVALAGPPGPATGPPDPDPSASFRAYAESLPVTPHPEAGYRFRAEVYRDLLPLLRALALVHLLLEPALRLRQPRRALLLGGLLGAPRLLHLGLRLKSPPLGLAL